MLGRKTKREKPKKNNQNKDIRAYIKKDEKNNEHNIIYKRINTENNPSRNRLYNPTSYQKSTIKKNENIMTDSVNYIRNLNRKMNSNGSLEYKLEGNH